MENKDFVRFQHILEATEAIFSFVKGKQQTSLDESRLLLSAVMCQFGIIGEAAARISVKTQESLPHLPWKQVIGMRNRMVHAYFDVDTTVVWNTICDHLPSFHSQVKAIVEAHA